MQIVEPLSADLRNQTGWAGFSSVKGGDLADLSREATLKINGPSGAGCDGSPQISAFSPLSRLHS
ncbi:MAG: hypothetical protein M3505_11335, partial [Verrucomicrobiota bacterium]|nr:hypothetical protein [Verrucomicrobiota bacterium]